MTVRVLRILEYVYADLESAEADMKNWGVPAVGTVRRGGGRYKSYLISSTVALPRTVTEGEVDITDITGGKQDG